MKEILMIGALLLIVGIKQGAGVAAHCGVGNNKSMEDQQRQKTG